MKIEEQSHHRTTLLDRYKDAKKIPYRKPEGVKYLESLIVEAKRKKYPNIPVEYFVSTMYRDDTANNLIRCVIDFIGSKGWQAERISTTGRPIDRTRIVTDYLGRERTIGSIEWIPGTCTNGSADVSATIAGWSVKIEVKINDRQSQAQKDYERSILDSEGIYYIARDFTSFLHWYNLNFSQP